MVHQLFVSFTLGFDIWRQNQNHDASSTVLSLRSTVTALPRVVTLTHSHLPALLLPRNNQESALRWQVSRVPREPLSLLHLAAKRGNPDRSSTPTAGL